MTVNPGEGYELVIDPTAGLEGVEWLPSDRPDDAWRVLEWGKQTVKDFRDRGAACGTLRRKIDPGPGYVIVTDLKERLPVSYEFQEPGKRWIHFIGNGWESLDNFRHYYTWPVRKREPVTNNDPSQDLK